jgi:hypothetical protein
MTIDRTKKTSHGKRCPDEVTTREFSALQRVERMNEDTKISEAKKMFGICYRLLTRLEKIDPSLFLGDLFKFK